MNVLILLVVIGIAMVALALIFFAWTLVARTFDQTDRLALLPLLEDACAEDASPLFLSASTASTGADAAKNPQSTAGTPLVRDQPETARQSGAAAASTDLET